MEYTRIRFTEAEKKYLLAHKTKYGKSVNQQIREMVAKQAREELRVLIEMSKAGILAKGGTADLDLAAEVAFGMQPVFVGRS